MDLVTGPTPLVGVEGAVGLPARLEKPAAGLELDAPAIAFPLPSEGDGSRGPRPGVPVGRT